MNMESIVIKLDRFGKQGKPDYSITINGEGKVIYEGRANVAKKGIAESFISEEDFMSLLSDFKNSDFFSLDEDFIKDESKGYNIISITLPLEEGKVKTRKIRFSDNFESLPESLIYLSNLIDEMVDSNRWIEEQKKEIPLKVRSNKKNKNKIIIIASLFVAAILIIAVFSTGFFDTKQTNNQQDPGENNNGGSSGDDSGGNNDSSGEQYFNPEIVFMTTTDQNARQYNQRSPSKNTFLKEETVYVDYEFQNVTHNGSYNITIHIIVNYNGIQYHNNTRVLNNTAFSDTFYLIDLVETEESWPTSSEDSYILNISIKDEISNLSTDREVLFNLIDEDLPKVIINANPTTGDIPLEVDFEVETENFTSTIANYFWYFDDGISDTSSNPSHTYYNEGTYEVTLTVTDDEENTAYGTATIVATDSINDSFEVDIDADPMSGSSPLDVTFTADVISGGANPLNYSWDFDYDGSGTFSAEGYGKTVQHRFETTEYYKSFWVFLKVVDSNNNETTDYIFIPVINNE